MQKLFLYQRESQYKRNKSVKKDLHDRVGIAISNGTINASDTFFNRLVAVAEGSYNFSWQLLKQSRTHLTLSNTIDT